MAMRQLLSCNYSVEQTIGAGLASAGTSARDRRKPRRQIAKLRARHPPGWLRSVLANRNDVVGNHSTFPSHDGTHGDAFGFVVVGAMQQIHGAKSGAKAQSGPGGFPSGSTRNKGTHDRIRLTQAFTQSTLRSDCIGCDKPGQNTDAYLIFECPERTLLRTGRLG